MRGLLIAAVAAVGSALGADLNVGVARVDITPPCGVFMPGYYVDRRVKEVLDPLAINMVAFSDGVRTAATTTPGTWRTSSRARRCPSG